MVSTKRIYTCSVPNTCTYAHRPIKFRREIVAAIKITIEFGALGLLRRQFVPTCNNVR